MIVSFNPCAPADLYLVHKGSASVTEDETEAMRSASAVILHQGCSAGLYRAARECCKNVFPDFSARFNYPGKIGQTELFRATETPHPDTLICRNLEHFHEQVKGRHGIPFPGFPLVFKFDRADEGMGVFLAENESRLPSLLDMAKEWERTGQSGFILQKYIPSGGKALRVVVIYKQTFAYWRVSNDSICINAARGAGIDHSSHPELIQKGVNAVKRFCAGTGINLAGFDLIFPEANPADGPLFLEINYYFGRRGLGGSNRYYEILAREIKRWLNDRGIK
ncbi:MAG: hypothetical protein B5M56_07120 [Desulfococcus sp. 4484_241]|nr:MAG: hypothetical protein B5M56_07120 [Desulfococcus sp. 4484_241]